MKVGLLAVDLDELERLDATSLQAVRRAARELGRRPVYDQAREAPHTEAGVAELVHLFAEAVADMRLLRFSYATSADDYAWSRRRRELVEEAMAELRRDVAPRLRARLRELRAREEELERAVAERGTDPSSIGPFVPHGTAIDTSPRPGEGEIVKRRLAPLPPRRNSLWRRLGLGRR